MIIQNSPEMLANKLLRKIVDPTLLLNPTKILKGFSAISPAKMLVMNPKTLIMNKAMSGVAGNSVTGPMTVKLLKNVFRAHNTKVVDLSKGKFNPMEKIALLVVQEKGVLSAKSLKATFKKHGLPLGKRRLKSLYADVSEAAKRLEQLGWLKEIQGKYGPFFTVNKRFTSEEISSEPVVDLIAKDHGLIADVIRSYGEFSDTNLRLYLQVQDEERRSFAQAMQEEVRSSIATLRSQDLLMDAIAENAYTTAPIDPTELKDLKVELIGESCQLAGGSQFDRDILAVLKSEGAFSEDNFYKHLAENARKIDPFDPEVQRAARNVNLVDYLKQQGRELDEQDGSWRVLDADLEGYTIKEKLFTDARGKSGNAVDWLVDVEGKSFKEAVQTLVRQRVADPKNHLHKVGWTDAQLKAAYKRKMNRLILLPDKTGLRYDVPSLRDLKTQTACAIAVPMERKTALVKQHPFHLMHLGKDLGLNIEKLGLANNLKLNQTHIDFMTQLGHFGVADQAGWNKLNESGLEKAAYLDAMKHGDLPNFEADFLYMAQSRNAGLGKLVKAGLVANQKVIVPTKSRTYTKRIYHLTDKGKTFLEALGKPSPVHHGPFRKKPSELRHEMLVYHTYLNETRSAFFEGKGIRSVKTDAQLEREAASERENLRNQIRNATGFSQHDRARLNALNRRKSLTPEQQLERADLQALSRFEFTPREAGKLEQLTARRHGPSFTSDMEMEYQHLKHLKAMVDQKAPGALERYKELQKSAIPDLVIEFDEEVELDFEEEPVMQVKENKYEIDSGAGRGGSGGYSTQEIAKKLQGSPNLIFATPGGTASSQGQKIMKQIQKHKARSRVISI